MTRGMENCFDYLRLTNVHLHLHTKKQITRRLQTTNRNKKIKMAALNL